ncbi:MAG: hypothetical protein J7K88_03895 [Candidatus Fermentibacteraceae bacterium]|nr:hypothetical protein [Candidatus Fermentibacteraceae bacterium]
MVSTVPVTSYDIMPTIVSYPVTDVPQSIEGVNILSGAPDQPRSIPCSSVSPDKFYLSSRALFEFQSCAVRCGTKKAIAYMDADNFIQFDWIWIRKKCSHYWIALP